MKLPISTASPAQIMHLKNECIAKFFNVTAGRPALLTGKAKTKVQGLLTSSNRASELKNLRMGLDRIAELRRPVSTVNALENIVAGMTFDPTKTEIIQPARELHVEDQCEKRPFVCNQNNIGVYGVCSALYS